MAAYLAKDAFWETRCAYLHRSVPKFRLYCHLQNEAGWETDEILTACVDDVESVGGFYGN